MAPKRHYSPEELAGAYQAIEKMRRMNLEVTCSERGITCNHECCTLCLLSYRKLKTSFAIFSLQTKKNPPCLICAAPTCPPHSAESFRKDNVTVCLQCEKFFDLDLEDCPDDPFLLQERFERIMDIYDRVFLLLKYAAQEIIGPLAIELDQHSLHNDSVGLSTSSVGIVSSVLGIAGMATIMTPAGAPLLMASLLTGGTSTAVTVGHEAMKSFNEQQKIADRILVLHGVLISILQATDDYRVSEKTSSLKIQREQYIKGLTSNSIVSKVDTGIKLGAKASYATTSAIPAASVMNTVPFLGPVLATAFMAMDAKSVKDTLHRIHNGSPCEKAKLLRAIHHDLEECIPPTETLDREFAAMIKVIEWRSQIRFLESLGGLECVIECRR